jgi:cyclopropane-fatty-acyl-phospholipid synthase
MSTTDVAERLRTPAEPVRHCRPERVIAEALARVGITLNGPNPRDIRVHDRRFFQRVLRGGDLALGESYVDGWWDCEELDEVVARVLRSDVERMIFKTWRMIQAGIAAWIRHPQSRARARRVAKVHYDLDHTLFEAMLGRTMAYSCAYWRHAATLDEAQEAKLDLACRKLDLKPSDTVLDLGCGWGSFARFAAERYGCSVVGITISRPQADYARRTCAGLPVRIETADYRDLAWRRHGPFTKVVSIGMFEHVGRRSYRTFFEIAREAIDPGGLFLLHSMGSYPGGSADRWIRKYIFPNGELPFARHLTLGSERLFRLEDWQDFGLDYDRTLMAWWRNFEARIGSGGLFSDERFCRMWRYYLLVFAGAYRSRVANQLWQVVFSPSGSQREYQSVR